MTLKQIEEILSKQKHKNEKLLYDQLKSYGFPKPTAVQYSPTKERKWTVDFVWKIRWSEGRVHQLAVEVHGGYVGTVSREVSRNYEKHNWLTLEGWCVLHVTPEMIVDGSAAVVVYKGLRKIGGFLEGWSEKERKWVPANKNLKRFVNDWLQ